jgi:hypothetical protein
MKKKWLGAAGVLLALVMLAAVVLVAKLDGLIMRAVNT